MSTLAHSEAQATPVPGPWLTRTLSIAYWTFTLIVAMELVFGSMWMLLQSEGARWVMTHLGYPLYVNYIIGVWKLPGAVALLVPRFERLKEWAYAGAVFNFSGAAASHLLAGDRPSRVVAPLMLTAMVLASWALRPSGRRLVSARPPARLRAVAWIAPLVIVGVFVILGLLTLPKAPPPR